MKRHVCLTYLLKSLLSKQIIFYNLKKDEEQSDLNLCDI
jgi:hypothetical protein